MIWRGFGPAIRAMKIIRFQPNNWRPDAATLISTGDYRIPTDMSEELAERALAEGAAALLSEEPETKPSTAALETKPARRVRDTKSIRST
jgi:hypothetical protein